MSQDVLASPEFIAEAQEIVDALNRDLIAAEQASRTGEVEPDLVNTLFRSAHSLKGISGMFGQEPITKLAHSLEGVLDSMRLGKVRINAAALDVLFACVERFGVLIVQAAQGESHDAHVIEEMMGRLQRVARGEHDTSAPTDPLELVGLGPDILGVLTEYEEHRLRENVRKGRGLYLLRSSFDLSNFDLGLAEMDAVVKGLGEVITKLPSSKESEPGKISFDIIVGSDCSIEDLSRSISDDRIEISTIQQRGLVRPADSARSSSTPAAGQEDKESEEPGPAAVAPPEPELVEESKGELREGENPTSLRSVSQTVRVDIRRLDRLMNLVGELALTKVAFQRISDVMRREQGFTGMAVELHKESRNFERRLAELQAGIMEVRMVPLANLFERMVRVGRKMGRELGREVRIEVRGESTELDKLIVEDLADPLMHLIRNAIDHGIEPPEARRAAGKNSEGVVRLTAAAQGNHVLVEVSDDGKGIDVTRILETAVQRGVVTAERAPELNRRDVFNLLFLPGFSTRTEVSEYSGRGVGLDVVKTNIGQLSGVIDVDSAEGQGTSFMVTLPITLAIIPALVVQVSSATYAIPLNNVLETIALSHEDVRTIERREVIAVRGATVPLVDLREVFDLGEVQRPNTVFGVVAGVGQSRMALVVDELVGQQDIVIKSLGKRLQHVSGIAGATELGNQQTILVIDMMGLINELSIEDNRLAEGA